jgi:tetratricopeptide (TPR) repeat protein
MIGRQLRRLARHVLLAAGLLCTAAPAAAQSSSSLDRVESLLAEGRLTEARATLDRWIAANPAGSRRTDTEDRARAQLLAGRLTSDVGEAESAYMSVVLSYPRTRAAPEALLRLGQVLVAVAIADADTLTARRASDYLGRLVEDYPRSEERPLGLLWLARAHEVAGAHANACAVTREALRADIEDPVLASLFETERDTACAAAQQAGAPASEAGAPARRGAADRPPPTSSTERTPPAPLERFAVQAAAVRNRAGAETLAARLRRAGYDPRIVRVEGSSLHRVRLGLFSNTAPAAQLSRRLRQAGFDAVVVTDAHREVRERELQPAPQR